MKLKFCTWTLLAMLMCVGLTSCDWGDYIEDELPESPPEETGIPSDSVPTNKIYYQTKDNARIELQDKDVFGGARIISNTYSSSKGYGTIVFDRKVTAIDEKAFKYRSELLCISLPNSVISIGYEAFYDTGLSSFTFPESIKRIESGVFSYSDLSSITIPNSVTSIGESAFYKCSKLSSITIPNSVTSIGSSAFAYCSNLSSITLPNSIKCIEKEMLAGCSKLYSITIPNSVTSIGESAFYNCSNLSSITIPNSVTSIGESAFYGCSNLYSITIPNSVTSIGEYAFYGCSKLSSIIIPHRVTSIEKRTFSDCSNLKTVVIGGNVKVLKGYAFRGCPITNFYTFTSTPSEIDKWDGNVFSELKLRATLHVPKGCVEAYKSSDWGDHFSNIVEITD